MKAIRNKDGCSIKRSGLLRHTHREGRVRRSAHRRRLLLLLAVFGVRRQPPEKEGGGGEKEGRREREVSGTQRVSTPLPVVVSSEDRGRQQPKPGSIDRSIETQITSPKLQWIPLRACGAAAEIGEGPLLARSGGACRLRMHATYLRTPKSSVVDDYAPLKGFARRLVQNPPRPLHSITTARYGGARACITRRGRTVSVGVGSAGLIRSMVGRRPFCRRMRRR
jgi:hypothetical protein